MKKLTALFLLLMTHLALADLYSVPLKDIEGKDTSLKSYEGKVLLVVNVASQCGLTPQYKALQALQEKYEAQGFTVLAFPCNDFGAQEPGTSTEIKQFCTDRYKVSFPIFEKLHVKGGEQHELYKQLSGPEGAFPGDVKWNFGKFLIGRDGKALKRFEPSTTPDSEEVTKAIEEAVAVKK